MATPRKLPEHLISTEVTAFIVDRRARRLSPATISYYQHELDWFLAWLVGQGIRIMAAITADVIRKYLIDLGQRRNENGCHASYRAIKAFLKWYADELDDPSYLNPLIVGSTSAEPVVTAVSTDKDTPTMSKSQGITYSITSSAPVVAPVSIVFNATALWLAAAASCANVSGTSCPFDMIRSTCVISFPP